MSVRRQPSSQDPKQGGSAKEEARLDEALQETFPASDPIAPFQDLRDGAAMGRPGVRRRYPARR
jgi:hypothetical protein